VDLSLPWDGLLCASMPQSSTETHAAGFTQYDRELAAAIDTCSTTGAPHHKGAEQPVPTIVFHGDRDTTVNPVDGDLVVAHARAGSTLWTTISRGQAPGGISYTRTVACDDSGHPMLEHWVLHGAGHAWSGGGPTKSYTELKGPDARREMMRYFLEHSKPAAAI
jgi:poly(3-hydroxybutyrate) depolymerase